MGLFRKISRNLSFFSKRNFTPIPLHKKDIYPSLSARLKDVVVKFFSRKKKFSLKEVISTKFTFRTWAIVVLSFLIIGIGYLMFGRMVQIYKQASGADPIAYWKFDEGQGSTAYTSIGTENGILSAGDSSPTWQTEEQCFSGKCLFFDGTDDYVSVVDGDVSGATTGSFSMWIKPTRLTTTFVPGVFAIQESSSPWDNGDGSLLLRLRENSGWKIELVYPNGGSATSLYGTTTITLNKWYHISATYDGSTYSLYVNGKLENSVSKSGNNFDTNQGPRIGHAYSGHYFAGFIDEVKAFDYALSADQIRTQYAGGSSAGSSAVLGQEDQSFLSDGLVGYWKMDESSGNASDSSGNNQTLTNNGITFPLADPSPVTFVAGKFGNGSEHGSPNALQYFSIGSTINEVKTVSFWTNPDSNSNYYVSLTSSAYITSSSGTVSAAGFNGPKIYVNGIASSTIEANTWSLVTITTDTFIDANTFYIGRQGSSYLDGTMDEVRLYNRALDPSEVQSLYGWAPGPVGYWKLDEGSGTSVVDSSGYGYTGMLGSGNSAPLWTPGKVGKGLTFDGSNDYFAVTDSTNSQLDFTSQMSMMAWVKPDVVDSTFRIFIEKGEPDEYELYYRAVTNKFAAEIGNTICDFTSDVVAGEWHHISATWDGSNIYVYQNGILENTCAKVYTMTPDDTPLTIGINPDSNDDHWDGDIDDIRLYNYVRTQKQIVQDMNAGHPAPGSPVGSALAHYRFDEGYGSTIHNVGNGGSTLDGTFGSGSSAPSWINDGKFGRAIRFDGTNDYITIADSNTIDGATGESQPRTLSAWLKYTSTATMVIAEKGTGNHLYFVTSNTLPGKIGWTCIGGSANDVVSDATINDNEWHHVVGTFDGSTLRLYIDGVKQSEENNIGPNCPSDDTAPLILGQRSGGLVPWPGSLDEVKIYNFALTEDQVKVEYNQGKAIVLGAGSTGVGGTTPSNSASREYCVPGDSSTCNAPVAEWKFDERSGTTANDTSENSNNGTLSNGPKWVTGKKGNALKFDGVNDLVTIPDPGTGSDIDITTGTWEVWFKIDTLPSVMGNQIRILDKYLGTGNQRSYQLVIFTNDNIFMDLDPLGTGAGDVRVSSDSSLSANQWYHVAVVADGSQAYMYINGVKQADVENFASVFDGTADLTFGGEASGNNFAGSIDEVRFYDYARTPAQLAWEYNQGKPAAWYRLDECTGTTAYNAAKNANGKAMGGNGTISIGVSGDQTSAGTCSSGTGTQAWNNGTTGRFNSSLNFDGTDDYIEIADDPMHELEFPFAITAWIKLNSLPSVTGDHYSIISKYKANTNEREWRFTVSTSSNRLNFLTSTDGSATDSELSNTSLTNDVGSWVHIAVSADVDGNIIFYRNGKNDGGGTYSSTTIDNTSATTTIGAVAHSSSTPDMFFDGQLDEVKIYRYNLTPEQIKTDMTAGAVRFE